MCIVGSELHHAARNCICASDRSGRRYIRAVANINEHGLSRFVFCNPVFNRNLRYDSIGFVQIVLRLFHLEIPSQKQVTSSLELEESSVKRGYGSSAVKARDGLVAPLLNKFDRFHNARNNLLMRRPRTQYAKADDLHIAYQVFGDGPFDLLWAQGWATHIEYAWESPDYARFLTKLSRFARVIFFDKRGVGMSDRDVGYPTLEERSRDINAVLDAAGSKKVAIFGASEGGAISSVFAATFPDRVSHLILNGSRACYQWHPDYPLGLKADQLRAEIEKFSDMSLAASEETSVDGAPSIADDPAAIEWLDTYFRYAASPRALSKLAAMNYSIDYRGVLSSIQVPTLVLHREGDRWCDVAHARYIAAHIPSSDLRILPGDDHIVWYGDQDAVIGEIRSFLTGDAVSRKGDRALKTVAFIDLVGSTEHLARMGDERWKSILEQLDHSVERRLRAFGGRKIKHTGDGYLLSFPGPTSAIECVTALRADAARLGLKSRTGVHTGECEVRGQDLSGLAVNVAARIMDQAEPDQILTSQTVKDLSLGADLEFDSLSARPLRGVPGEWPLFALT